MPSASVIVARTVTFARRWSRLRGFSASFAVPAAASVARFIATRRPL